MHKQVDQEHAGEYFSKKRCRAFAGIEAIGTEVRGIGANVNRSFGPFSFATLK